MFSKNLVLQLADIRKHGIEGMETELQSATSKEVEDEDRSLQNQIQEESVEEWDEKDKKEIQEESVEEWDEKDKKEIKEESVEEWDENDKKEGKFDIFNWMEEVKDGPKREKKFATVCPPGTRRSSRLVNRINYSEDLESSKDVADAEKAGTLGKIQEEESEEENIDSDESYKGTDEESGGESSDESRNNVSNVQNAKRKIKESDEESDENYKESNVQHAKRKIKESDEESDENYKESNVKNAKMPTKKKNVKNAKRKIKESDEESDENYKEKSTYQQMIEKNRKEKMAFLESIHMNEAKMDFLNAMKRHKPVKREKKPVVRPTVLRKSVRLVNCSTIQKNYSEKILTKEAIVQAKTVHKRILPNLSFKDALGSEDLYGLYVEDINIQESKYETKFITYDKSDLEKMTLSVNIEDTIQLTPGSITGLVWYPSPEQLIVAGGDNYGSLGILNVNNKSEAYGMKIHHNTITNLQFNPFNPVQLISSGEDGILCCSDLIKHTFDELYNVSNTTYCTNFEFLSATTFLVAQENGQVAVVDRRNGKSFEMRHPCSVSKINTVSVHPVHGSYFISANTRGSIDLWDLRKLKKCPVQSLDYHKRSVRSAFFSPVTGDSILTTCDDHCVRIFDSSDLENFEFKCSARFKEKKHSTFTTKATWLPNSDETLVFGKDEHNCGAVVYDKHFHVYHNLTQKYAMPYISSNVFHPTRHALASGRGHKLFVFT